MKKLWTLVLLLLATFLVAAQDKGFQYYVFPVKGITGISKPVDGKQRDDNPRYGGMIDAKYADEFFSESAQQELNAFFQSEIRNRFPKSIVSPKQVTKVKEGSYEFKPDAQCRESNFSVDYGDTYAISIGINRLSVYINIWDKYADIFIPVSYSLRFIQMATGELAFTLSETVNTRYISGLAANVIEPGAQQPGKEQITKAVLSMLGTAIREDAKKIVSSLVEKSAKSFNPKKTTVPVVGRDGRYIIFGAGSEVGFSSGSATNSTNEQEQDVIYQILYATKGLAIGVVSGEVSLELQRMSDRVGKGDKVNFVFSKQGKDDAKPTVLVNQFLAGYMPNKKLSPQQILNNALSSILADNVGFDAPFNVIKHDPDNFRLLNQIKSEANCESSIYEEIPGFAANSKYGKELPDFFLKLDAFNSPSYTRWGVGNVNSNTSFNTSVALSLVDRSGVVRQAFLGTERTDLSRSVGKGLSYQDAIEVNLKNATLSAVDELTKKFKYKDAVIPIKSLSAGVLNVAQPLPVSIFDDAQLVRAVSFSGKTIFVPIDTFEAKLVKPSQDTDRLEYKGKLSKDDFIQVPSLDYSRKPMVRCDGKNGRIFQNGLSVPSGADVAISPVSLYGVKGFRLMEVDTGFLTSVKSVLKDAHFPYEGIFESQTATACYLVMEFQGTNKNECAAGKCVGSATVSSGVRVYDGDNKVAESIATSKFDFSDIDAERLPDFISLKAYENQIQNYLNHQSKLFTKE
jgi:hypothetical protein